MTEKTDKQSIALILAAKESLRAERSGFGCLHSKLRLSINQGLY